MSLKDSACRLVLLVALTSYALAKDEQICKDPGDPRKTAKSDGEIHWSFLNNPQFRQDPSENLPIAEGSSPRYTGREGFRTLREATDFLKRYGGSLCPSTFKLQYDENRYPRVLKQAVCMCRRCRLIRRKKFRCEPVIAHERVWRKNTCKEGVWEYKPVWEEVAVACSCNLKKRNKQP